MSKLTKKMLSIGLSGKFDVEGKLKQDLNFSIYIHIYIYI